MLSIFSRQLDPLPQLPARDPNATDEQKHFTVVENARRRQAAGQPQPLLPTSMKVSTTSAICTTLSSACGTMIGAVAPVASAAAKAGISARAVGLVAICGAGAVAELGSIGTAIALENTNDSLGRFAAAMGAFMACGVAMSTGDNQAATMLQGIAAGLLTDAVIRNLPRCVDALTVPCTRLFNSWTAFWAWENGDDDNIPAANRAQAANAPVRVVIEAPVAPPIQVIPAQPPGGNPEAQPLIGGAPRRNYGLS